MLVMKKLLEKDFLGKWNTLPPVPEDKLGNVNCHKFVLYVIGKISWEEMVSDADEQKESGADFTFGEKARSISDTSFTPVEDLKSLLSLANESLDVGKCNVGQILDAQTGEMAHSFIIKRESDNKHICFDKPGFKYMFEINDLESILNFVNKNGEKSNQNQKWRFIPTDDFR